MLLRTFAPTRHAPWMKIGIIGVGAIGGTLASALAHRGHQVSTASSRGPEKLEEQAAKIGARAVTVQEAARENDVVIISIPQNAIPDLPQDLFAGAPSNVTVVETGNYCPRLRDGRIEALEAGTLDSEWVSEHLGRPVVKAFNNIYAKSLLVKGAPPGSAERIALSVAGDPPEARAATLRIVDELGFEPVDAGSLGESWRQQPGTPAYCNDLNASALKRALAEADRKRLSEYRREAEDLAERLIRAS